MRARPILVCVAVMLATACTGGDDAGPSPTTRPTTPTSVIDRSGIQLAGVGGSTTSTIVERGTASLSGSVTGPGGLLVGATVRIERLVAGREIRTDVLTGPDGRFLLSDMPGGRYRVRAFLAPTYAQLEPEVRFLEDGQEHVFDLAVRQQSGLVVRADAAPNPPQLDRAVNLVAVVSTRSVDADGVVRFVPVSGSTVELVGLGRWQLRDDSTGGPPSSPSSTPTTLGSTTSTTRRTSGATMRTDSAGRVRYELRCHTAGSPGLALRIPVTITPPPDPSGAPVSPRSGVEVVPLDLPDCIDPATTTTTAAPTTSSSSSTTTEP